MAGAECLQSLAGFEFSYVKIEVLICYLLYSSVYTPLPISAVRDLGPQSFCSQAFTDEERSRWFLPLLYSSLIHLQLLQQ